MSRRGFQRPRPRPLDRLRPIKPISIPIRLCEVGELVYLPNQDVAVEVIREEGASDVIVLNRRLGRESKVPSDTVVESLSQRRAL